MESLEELITACNTATDGLYQQMAPARARNRQRASQYLDLGSRLGAHLSAAIEKHGSV